MACFWHNLLGGFCAVAGFAAVCSAPAQSSVPASSQSVLLSSPPGNGLQLPGIMPASRNDRPNLGNDIQAPHSLFNPDNNDAADSMTPRPSPQINALQQMMQEHKKDWAEMTPEEIMGVAAPQKNSLLPGAGQEDNTYHSPLEKFLMEKRQAQTGSTNLLSNAPNEGWNFLDKDTGLPDPRRVEDMRNGLIVRSEILDRWLQNAQDFNQNQQQSQDADWARIFTAPQPAQPTPAQLADMVAFKQMLDPTAAADAESRSQPKISTLPEPDPDLNPQPAGYNPIGSTYAPVSSGIGRPNGINPLPTITSSPVAPSGPPDWAPKPPPWTLTTPQLFVNPVRRW